MACATAAAVLVPAHTASAASLPDCDTSTNPAANTWDGQAGQWSDPLHWSLGHAPDADEDACVLDGTPPVIDGDITVRSLMSGVQLVPTGTLTATVVAADLTVAQGASVVVEGTDAAASGTWVVAGSIRFGGTVDTSSLTVQGQPGASTTVDAGEPVVLASMQAVDTLSLVGDTHLTVSGGAVSVARSVLGAGGALVVDSGTATIGSTSTASTIEATIDAEQVVMHGAVTVTGTLRHSNALTLVASSQLDFDGASIETGFLVIEAPTGVQPAVEFGSGTSLQAVLFEIGDRIDASFTGCTMGADMFHVQVYGVASIIDLACIDPPPGVTRSIDGDARDSAPADVRIMASGVLDGGGSLILGRRIDISAGVTLVDASTVLGAYQDGVTIGVLGTGTARIDDLMSGTALVSGWSHPVRTTTGAGQVLQLHDPARVPDTSGPSCVGTATSKDGGRLEIIDDSPQESGCVFLDAVGPGSSPTTYRHGLTTYEPRRHWVGLNGGSWSPTGTGRAWQVLGWGAVYGSVDVDSLYIGGGTLRIIGSIAARDASFAVDSSGAPTGVLDLSDAPVQSIDAASIQWGGAGNTTAHAATGSSWVVAPGIQRSYSDITRYRITVDAGTVISIASGSGVMSVAAPPVDEGPPPPPAPPTDDTTDDARPVLDWVKRIGSHRGDRLTGTVGHDILLGRGGNDVLRGSRGNDRLDGGAGSDYLDGGAGNDRITCGTGLRDRALGSTGNDVIACRDRGRGRDIVDCGPGRDRAVVDRRDIVRRCEVVVRR